MLEFNSSGFFLSSSWFVIIVKALFKGKKRKRRKKETIQLFHPKNTWAGHSGTVTYASKQSFHTKAPSSMPNTLPKTLQTQAYTRNFLQKKTEAMCLITTYNLVFPKIRICTGSLEQRLALSNFVK